MFRLYGNNTILSSGNKTTWDTLEQATDASKLLVSTYPEITILQEVAKVRRRVDVDVIKL